MADAPGGASKPVNGEVKAVDKTDVDTKVKKETGKEGGEGREREEGDEVVVEEEFLEPLEEGNGGPWKAEVEKGSVLHSSRYGDELSLRVAEGRGGEREGRGRGGGSGAGRPRGPQPRHVLVLSALGLGLALTILWALARKLDGPPTLYRDDGCEWSQWRSVHGRHCLCDDSEERSSSRCGRQRVVCASQPCPIPLPSAAALHQSFCWEEEPCRSGPHNFLFLRRSLFRRSPSVYWPEEGRHFLSCSVLSEPPRPPLLLGIPRCSALSSPPLPFNASQAHDHTHQPTLPNLPSNRLQSPV